MVAGAWVGWRLFAIGGIAAAAVVFGYLAIGQHYYLWMAGCGGGTLIAGGTLAEEDLMDGPDELIHQSTRLKLTATLNSLDVGESLEFGRLKAILVRPMAT